jgi:hypothetical protein
MAAVKREPDSAAIQNVIHLLEHASRAPGMWLGNVTLWGAMHFLTGFEAGLHVAFDIGRIEGTRSQVVEDRGYRVPRHAVQEWLDQIQERFPDELDAARERLTIELEAWKLLRDSPS